MVAQSDLYVHTALNDNCPYALLEAFAVHVPVLALPVGGIPELLPHGHGLLNERDPAPLAKLVLTYRDPVKRNQLTAAQTRYAEKRLSHEAGLQRLLTFYGQILGESDQPAEPTNVPGQPTLPNYK